MKKLIFICVLAMTFAAQAFAFNPDPTKYEYIGQRKADGSSIFYEIATARSDGQKGVIVLLQADPKNRTVRYYKNVVIDPSAMTIRAGNCELYDYRGNVLETFSLPNEAVNYQSGDLTDKRYKELRAKGIVPPPPPPPVYRYVQPVGWQAGLSGGEEAPIVDLPSVPDNEPIIDI